MEQPEADRSKLDDSVLESLSELLQRGGGEISHSTSNSAAVAVEQELLERSALDNSALDKSDLTFN